MSGRVDALLAVLLALLLLASVEVGVIVRDPRAALAVIGFALTAFVGRIIWRWVRWFRCRPGIRKST